MTSALLLIAVLAVLILVHEAGHFLAAKAAGIRVDEFGFGFPPKLIGIRKGETEYTFNAIPFGGFVRMHGEDAEEDVQEDRERSFTAQSRWVQAGVIAAGVFGNFVLAWILFSGALFSGVPMPIASAPEGAQQSETRIAITSVVAESPAAEAGIMAGDRIGELSSDGETVIPRSLEDVQTFIAAQGTDDIDLTYIRGGSEHTAILQPERGLTEGREQPAIGITMQEVANVSLPVHYALWEGALMTGQLTVAVVVAFGNIIANVFTGGAVLDTLSGPVGIAGIAGDAAGFGFAYFATFIALISVNLGVLNLIPFPALDGGRLLFLGIEAVKGSPINQRFTHYAHLIGFALLILLMLVVTYNDIVRLL